jgi:hypothetical protein
MKKFVIFAILVSQVFCAVLEASLIEEYEEGSKEDLFSIKVLTTTKPPETTTTTLPPGTTTTTLPPGTTTQSPNVVSCEKMHMTNWHAVGDVYACFLNEITVINSSETTISNKNEDVTALEFSNNENIFMLPVKVAESFPNLRAFGVARCSVRAVTKENFKGLTKLRYLSLNQNKIEKIPSDTFADLVSLDQLFLCKNAFVCYIRKSN